MACSSHCSDVDAKSNTEKRAILESGTQAKIWAEDARLCQRVSEDDETMYAIRAEAFAVREIIAAGLDGAINVKGRQWGVAGRRRRRTTLELIPADTFDGATIDERGKLYPENPHAPDAVIYEALRFPRDRVLELWPASSDRPLKSQVAPEAAFDFDGTTKSAVDIPNSEEPSKPHEYSTRLLGIMAKVWSDIDETDWKARPPTRGSLESDLQFKHGLSKRDANAIATIFVRDERRGKAKKG